MNYNGNAIMNLRAASHPAISEGSHSARNAACSMTKAFFYHGYLRSKELTHHELRENTASPPVTVI